MTTIDSSGAPTAKRTGRHPINVGHFVMGIAFLGIVLIWILIEGDAVTGDDIRWLLPVPWVLAGVAGLLATTRRKHPETETYNVPHRGWVGHDPAPAPVEDSDRTDRAYDDLDEKLARAERETRAQTGTQATTATAAPSDPPDPADPAER